MFVEGRECCDPASLVHTSRITPCCPLQCKGGDACDACDPATQQCTACGTGYGLDAQRQCEALADNTA